MFSRLNKPLQESEQLEIILHNIRPCYASTLAASPELNNLDTLKEVRRNYEIIQSRLKQFRNPYLVAVFPILITLKNTITIIVHILITITKTNTLNLILLTSQIKIILLLT